MSRAPALLSVLVVVGCGDCAEREGAPPEDDPNPEVGSPLELFPVSPGDRWRVEAGEEGTAANRGITGVDDSGVAVLFGTDRTQPERFQVTEDEVVTVGSDGHFIVPLLRAPLRTDAEWRYELMGGLGRCRAFVHDTAVTSRVGPLRIDGCVRVRRRCEHAAGPTFREDTVHESEEVYCPGLGPVLRSWSFEPPVFPAGTERVVGYRVRGAPRWPPPETFDCRSFILLPSDVQAACGAAVEPLEPVAGRSGDDRCTYRFRAPDGEITVSAERGAAEPTVEELDGALGLPGGARAQTHEGARFASVDAEVRFALSQGRVVVTSRAPEAVCPEESAMRLVPLLRSLLR